ncbi:MAG TPA: hypothetical protein VFR86_26540 [Burkholderiaceae bacterium]|nr:hypothetical protein [Burkholderiaceae bacterium]
MFASFLILSALGGCPLRLSDLADDGGLAVLDHPDVVDGHDLMVESDDGLASQRQVVTMQ